MTIEIVKDHLSSTDIVVIICDGACEKLREWKCLLKGSCDLDVTFNTEPIV